MPYCQNRREFRFNAACREYHKACFFESLLACHAAGVLVIQSEGDIMGKKGCAMF